MGGGTSNQQGGAVYASGDASGDGGTVTLTISTHSLSQGGSHPLALVVQQSEADRIHLLSQRIFSRSPRGERRNPPQRTACLSQCRDPPAAIAPSPSLSLALALRFVPISSLPNHESESKLLDR